MISVALPMEQNDHDKKKEKKKSFFRGIFFFSFYKILNETTEYNKHKKKNTLNDLTKYGVFVYLLVYVWEYFYVLLMGFLLGVADNKFNKQQN